MNLFKTARSSLAQKLICNYIIFIANAKQTSGYKMLLKMFSYERKDDNFKKKKMQYIPKYLSGMQTTGPRL